MPYADMDTIHRIEKEIINEAVELYESRADVYSPKNHAALLAAFNFLLLKRDKGLVESLEAILPDLGIMAATSMSREAVEWVNGFNKAKSEIISLIKKQI